VDGRNVIAVGANGTVVRWTDDGGWNVIALPTTADLHVVYVNRRGDAFLAGESGMIYVQDGWNWKYLPINMTENIRGLTGYMQKLVMATDEGNLWVLELGANGPILSSSKVGNGPLVGVVFAEVHVIAVSSAGDLYAGSL
jgi:hypothetical protein